MRKGLPNLLPIIFIITVLGLTVYGLWIVRELAVNAAHPAPASPMTTDDLKARIEELKWILALIVTAAGLFTIAQAAAAWFSSQTFSKQAEDTLKRVADVEQDVESRYPVFSDYEKVRREAYVELAHSLKTASSDDQEEGYDWRENLYEVMDIEKRQKLLSVERFIGIEFLRRPLDDLSYPQNLRRLANFYVSKFQFEREHKFGYLGDLERAHYYLDLARERTEDAFYLLNDIGVLHALWYPQVYTQDREAHILEAVKLFDQSRADKPHQQRAYYNLGAIESVRKNWESAADWCEQGIKHELWEETLVDARKGDLYYNLACYHARVAALKRQVRHGEFHVDRCLWALGIAAGIGQVKGKTVNGDYAKEGDLYDLFTTADKKVVADLNQLRPELSKRKIRKEVPQNLADKMSAVGAAVRNLFTH